MPLVFLSTPRRITIVNNMEPPNPHDFGGYKSCFHGEPLGANYFASGAVGAGGSRFPDFRDAQSPRLAVFKFIAHIPLSRNSPLYN